MILPTRYLPHFFTFNKNETPAAADPLFSISNTYVNFFFFLKIKPTKFAIDVQVNRDIILQGIGVFLPYGSEIYGNVQIEGK